MIQSVDRALKLLAIIASHKDWIGVREIARMAGLKASTCQNFLKTLQANGFLEFNAATRRGQILGQLLDTTRNMTTAMGGRVADSGNGPQHK